jgi:hypothetical protein
MPDDSEGGFAGIPRGRPLSGPRAIAKYIWNDVKRARTVYGLDRNEFGLVVVAGKLTGFTRWIDLALSRKAGRRRDREANSTHA